MSVKALYKLACFIKYFVTWNILAKSLEQAICTPWMSYVICAKISCSYYKQILSQCSACPSNIFIEGHKCLLISTGPLDVSLKFSHEDS